MTDSPDRLPETENWVEKTVLSRRSAIAGTAAIMGYALAAQPVAQTTITTNTVGLDAGMVEFATGDIKMKAYRAKPLGKKNAPVIIVVQEIFGVHEWIKDIVRRFAHAGYYAIAPDLYARQGDATQYTEIGKLFTEVVSKVPDAQVMSDLDALTMFVGSDGGNKAKIGITGFCWGGRITWLYAAHNPKIKAGVAWYGRLINSGKPQALQPKNPIELVAALNAPVLGLYGALDKGIPVSDVDKMNAALKAAKSKSNIHLYPQADHGFLADYRPSYNKQAADDGWAKALAWFGKAMK
jgi:carboxymethylenebutenolidase